MGSKEALLIGGTGTLGHALTPILLSDGFNVTVISREELKQKQFKKKYPDARMVLADVRDYSSLVRHCIGKDAVFHLAAMKHVDMAEDHVEESIKINLLGSLNVAKACIEGNVGAAALSSTDKAVLPVNAYGMCKGLSEKYWQNCNEWSETTFNVFRWGNVLGSRGSVIHAFVETLTQEKKVYITDPEMTRFWIHIDDVARFMVDNHDNATEDCLFIPAMKAASVTRLAEITAQFLGIRNFEIKITNARKGEKIHESLDHMEGMYTVNSNEVEQFSDEELFKLIERTLFK